MINKKILYKLTHGMYVLTTPQGGCFVDAVCQISGGDNPLVSVAVMKKNLTNELMHQENRFGLSIFGMNDNVDLIKTFGLNSGRDIDKFKECPNEIDIIEGVPIIKDTLGYLVLEKIDTIENDTHTLFIGRVIEGDKFKDEESMTYSYYQEHKDELMKVKTEEGKTAWICSVCGYVYYGETLPNDFVCPICGVGKEMFEKK